MRSDSDQEAELMKMLKEARALVLSLETRLGLRGPAEEPIHPIARWRRIRGLTQRELAARVGITPPALNRIEHRPGFAGRKETRERIAKALNVSEEDLRAPMDVGRYWTMRAQRRLVAQIDKMAADDPIRHQDHPEAPAGGRRARTRPKALSRRHR